jgi:hypothetical protein
MKDFFDGSNIKQAKRIWEVDMYNERLMREADHKKAHFSVKFFRKGRKLFPTIPAEEWTIFPGDQVYI